MVVKRVPRSKDSGSVTDPVRSVTAFVVLTAEPTDPLILLARRMKLFDCGALMVEGSPPAIVSERDLLRAIADGQGHLLAKDLATPSALSVDADADIGEAAALMVMAQVRHLLVEDGERYGIISMRDLVEPLLASALH